MACFSATWSSLPFSPHQKQKKIKMLSELDPLWQKVLDPRMNDQSQQLLMYILWCKS